jgi:hypothetical protein
MVNDRHPVACHIQTLKLSLVSDIGKHFFMTGKAKMVGLLYSGKSVM